MGFKGDADDNAFPYVSNFTIPYDQKVKIEFVFSYYSDCDDQGVILFSESATPIFNWGTVNNGLIGQWNCGFPVIGWSNGNTEPDVDNWPSLLEIGSAYLGIFEYDPRLSNSNLKLTTKSYTGQIIDSIVVDQLLPPGEDYKIGFTADSDGSGEGDDFTAYFKNLKISIG